MHVYVERIPFWAWLILYYSVTCLYFVHAYCHIEWLLLMILNDTYWNFLACWLILSDMLFINPCDFSEWIYEWEYIWDFVIAHCSFCCLGVDAFAHILSLLAKLPTGILSSNCSYLPGFCTLMHKYWLLVWLGSLLY